MFKNYLKTIIRQLRKHKTFSLVNVIGLSVGMSACLVISHYGYFHSTFDQYHSNADRLFRIQREATKNGLDLGETSTSAGLMGPTLVETQPEVLNATRFFNMDYQNNSITHKTENEILSFEEEAVYATDASTFDLFDISFISGSAELFDEPSKMVMTRKVASKYFDDLTSALGTTVTMSGNTGTERYEVVGIIEDQPDNSHLQFNVLLSTKSIEKRIPSLSGWTGGTFFTYLLLEDPSQTEKVIKSMQVLYEDNAAKKLEEYGYIITDYKLLNIKDIHLTSKDPVDFSPPMNARLVYGLVGIAIIILVIAWINYLNLSLVKTLERMKEVGIRKVLGSNTLQIGLLFVYDALTLNVISFVLALTFVQLASPLIEGLTGISFNIYDDPIVLIGMLGLILFGSLLIGFYPSALLKTLNTSQVLLGNRNAKLSGSSRLRSVLVTTQFIITFLLMAVTITIYRQIEFMKSSELGFDKDNIMVLKAPPGDISSEDRADLVSFNAFKTELKKQSGIKAITNAGEIPGQPISWGTNLYLESESAEKSVDTRLISMGSEFLDFFDLKVIAGRGVLPGDDPWENKDVFINKKMTELLGYDNPEDAIGADLKGFWVPLEVRGVLEDHHHNSLHEDYEPIAYIISSWTEFYFIKFSIGDDLTPAQQQATFKSLVKVVENEWNTHFAANQIDYFFLDQFYNLQYAEDEHFGRVFGVFSMLAILIACLGLFGLTSFTLKQRTKEIGIRKVLGASSQNLIMLLSRNYLLIIGIAYIISMPLAWISMERWLEDYAFHIELGIWILAIPLVMVLAVAIATLISKLMITVRMNPVHSLRNE